MEIRKVTKEDINKGLKELFIEGFRFHNNGRPDIFTNKSEDELIEELTNDVENSNYYLIIDNNNIVGYVKYKINDKHARVLWVDQIVIKEEYRKHGYGKELMNKLEEFAKKDNCVRMELSCWEFNENAIDMYKHIGFGEQQIKMEKKIKY